MTARRAAFPHIRRDLAASLVVFLVALPLCVGVAVASGVPAELGLVTGIVGGVVTGLLRGSTLQVSGPAAGLTVLVLEAVREFGLTALGVLVLATGLLQILMGALRLGRWFRAISVSVVEGMLAGIGLVLIAGQLYSVADAEAPASGTERLAGLPGTLARAAGDPETLAAIGLGAGTVAVLVLWPRMPRRVRALPGPLAAVALATAATAAFSLPVATVEVEGLLGAVQPPGADTLGILADPAVYATIIAFTLIASAESLFSAAAVDRMHDGPRTRYDQELMAQGTGNAVCGLLGALPMTAVIVRSAANVRAGARTRAARVLHGVWLLVFAALLPATLGLLPLPALAGVLLHAGWKLIPFRGLLTLWRGERGEALILVATAVSIVALNMFEGVLIGLALSVAKAAWGASHVRLEVRDPGAGPVRARLSGNATFLRLPKILDSLEALPQDRPVELDLSGLHHLDHACRTALENWAERHSAAGTPPVRLTAR
ncbi:SulP family inorganic anion transporter [Streptomyces sp. KAU_LT]|uniref:SulP family inorganic anion transporter n=1 Tax=Streptomyces sp. KAU_LT TaxID=3046669 RepID=UPI0024B7AEA3|nr:SulP family inorganic anion transporter [Streptomyces sp. KAU_LT]MDI9830524.1 SulP family inorganic anion transporter [Streptomyces sp. KAU_LT]